MIVSHSNHGYRRLLNGIDMRTLAYGDKTLMSEFLLAQGCHLPLHSHPHEQTGYLIKGRGRLTIAGVAHEVLPGDSWNVPGGVEHEAEFFEDSVAIEVFSPVREDYLPDQG